MRVSCERDPDAQDLFMTVLADVDEDVHLRNRYSSWASISNTEHALRVNTGRMEHFIEDVGKVRRQSFYKFALAFGRPATLTMSERLHRMMNWNNHSRL